MIAKLTCDQIAEMWPVIKEGMQKDLHFPIMGKHRYRESNILESLLTGAMDAWVVYTKMEEEETIQLHLVVLTTVYIDRCTRNKSLFIFSILGYRPPGQERWEELRVGLIKYANSKGCHNITSMTNDPKILERARSLGGDTSFTYVTFEIGEDK